MSSYPQLNMSLHNVDMHKGPVQGQSSMVLKPNLMGKCQAVAWPSLSIRGASRLRPGLPLYYTSVFVFQNSFTTMHQAFDSLNFEKLLRCSHRFAIMCSNVIANLGVFVVFSSLKILLRSTTWITTS